MTGTVATAIVAGSVAALGLGAASAAASTRPDGGAQARVASIACPSAGNCTATGYMIPPGQNQAFVVSEQNGTWRQAERIPGLSALPGGSVRALPGAVSCSSAGNCGAGGLYVDKAGNGQAFVVSEKNGKWGNAEEVPGSAALNVGGDAIIEQMSCTLAGGCLAAGTYESDSSMDQQAFVVQEIGGVWGAAEDIPGLDALNAGGVAEVRTLYCVHTGNCTVGGDYNDGSGAEPFVAYQNYGEWYSAQTFPDIAAANTGRIASIDSLSCQRRGICTGVGTYRTSDGDTHVFADSEQSYIWSGFQPIPGMAALPKGGAVHPSISFLSCPSAVNCTAGGTYADKSGNTQSYIVTQANGVWGSARVLPGLAALGASHFVILAGLSCRSAGNCTAAGSYVVNLKTLTTLVFVVAEKNGKWGKAQALPGSAVLSKGGNLDPEALSCGAPSWCSVGGAYATQGGRLAPFIATQKNGIWGKAERVPGTRP